MGRTTSCVRKRGFSVITWASISPSDLGSLQDVTGSPTSRVSQPTAASARSDHCPWTVASGGWRREGWRCRRSGILPTLRSAGETSSQRMRSSSAASLTCRQTGRRHRLDPWRAVLADGPVVCVCMGGKEAGAHPVCGPTPPDTGQQLRQQSLAHLVVLLRAASGQVPASEEDREVGRVGRGAAGRCKRSGPGPAGAGGTGGGSADPARAPGSSV